MVALPTCWWDRPATSRLGRSLLEVGRLGFLSWPTVRVSRGFLADRKKSGLAGVARPTTKDHAVRREPRAMTLGANQPAGRHLLTLFHVGTVGDLTDGQVLERFVSGDGAGRGGVSCPGRAARADGAARLPTRPGRPPRRGGRLPGDVPAAGEEGRGGPQGRLVGELAARRRPAGRLRRPRLGRAAAEARGTAPSSWRRARRRNGPSFSRKRPTWAGSWRKRSAGSPRNTGRRSCSATSRA